MTTITRGSLLCLLTCLASQLLAENPKGADPEAASHPFEVSGMKFTAPAAFQSLKPTSAMRKAQFRVGADEAEGEIVFFYFGAGGAGGVQANVNRWYGQFQEGRDKINAKSEQAQAGETPVTFVSAEGTFLSGPPRGTPVAKPGYALLGAIVEAKAGAIFVKFTGPQATVKAHTEAFKTMITSAR